MPIDDELRAELESLIDMVTINPEELAILNANSALLPTVYLETRQAVLMKHWPLVILAQVNKAIKGDTASAKFLTDIVSELGESDSDTSRQQDILAWEEKAIELRDKLGIELSAVVMVEVIINSLLLMPSVKLRAIINDLGIRLT